MNRNDEPYVMQYEYAVKISLYYNYLQLRHTFHLLIFGNMPDKMLVLHFLLVLIWFNISRFLSVQILINLEINLGMNGS